MNLKAAFFYSCLMAAVAIAVIAIAHGPLKSTHTQSTTPTTTAPTTTTNGHTRKSQVYYAEVDDMSVKLAQTSSSFAGRVDVVKLWVQNPTTDSNRAAIDLEPFKGNKLDAPPTVLKVSVPAATYVPKAGVYPYWIIPLRWSQFKRVVFTIRSTGDTKYCIGGGGYVSTKGHYYLCGPNS